LRFHYDAGDSPTNANCVSYTYAFSHSYSNGYGNSGNGDRH
jgi:hypothetical protein